MRAEVMGRDRYNSRSSEIAEMLAPLMVSERTLLGFYRALCERFGVDPTGAESQYGPIDVWLTEGRCRWDRVIAAMSYRECLSLVHECPDLIASYACDHFAAENEDAMFEDFSDTERGEQHKPELPGSLLQPNSYATVWTLTSPMHHGADVKHGNVNMFRRKRVFDAITGESAYVPFVAGNAVRGLMRDMIMGRWLQLIGLKTDEIPTARAHAILSGGAVQKGADTGTVQNDVRRRARMMCPAWDLLGGCTDQQIMSGRVRIGDANLVCRENAWKMVELLSLGADPVAFRESLRYASEQTSLRLGTRHKHADIPDADGVQMLWNTELLTEGAQMTHSIQLWGLDGVDPVTAACLADWLQDFRSVAVVGAAAARGMGQIAFDPYRPLTGATALPDPSVYLEHIEAHKAEMQDWAMMRNEPGKLPELPTARKTRGSKKVAEPEPSEDIDAGGAL